MSHRSTPHRRFVLVQSLVVAVAVTLGAGCATAPRTQSQWQTHGDGAASAAAAPASVKTAADPRLAKSFEDAVARGDTAWGNGDADMAVYLYVQALSFRPRDIDTLCKISAIEQQRGNLMLAGRALELAATADPDNARLTGRLGLLLLVQGDDEKARTWLQRSEAAHNPDWRIFDGLGVLEQRRDDNAAALRYAREAIALAPAEPAPHLHAAQALFNEGDYAGAEDAVRGALSRVEFPEAQRLLGQVEAKRRNYAAAIDSLLRVSDPPTAYSTVAKLALDNDDNAVALRYFEKASTASPTYFAEAQRNAAIARERLDSSSNIKH